MATGKASDFKIYNPEFFGGMAEALEQNTDGFNAASGGAMVLMPERKIGDLEKESFLARISSIVTRRDTTSVDPVTDIAATMGESLGIKINRKIGPIANTLDSWRKVGVDPSTMSFRLGGMIGAEIAVDYIDQACRAASTAIASVGALTSNQTAGTLSHARMNSGLSLFGDAGSRIRMLVMHSTPWYNLIGNAITDNIFQVGGMSIQTGSNATFGKPVLVTDSSALVTAATSAVDSVGVVAGLINKSGLAAAGPFVVGQYVTLEGFAATENNATWRITAVDVDDLTVDGTLTDEAAAGGQTCTGVATYATLALQSAAVVIAESEERQIVGETVTGLEQLVGRVQGEYAYNIKVRGYSWDTAVASTNPTDAQVGTVGAWDKVANQNKATAGIRIDTL